MGADALTAQEASASIDEINPENSPARNIFACVLIFLAALAVYSNSFGGAFVFDDLSAIRNNPAIKTVWPPWSGMLLKEHMPVAGRPLVHFSLALNYWVSGFDVWSYHLLNLGVHCVTAILIFFIMRRTLLHFVPEVRRSFLFHLSFAVALLWILHPLQTQAVTYVIQRCESMVSMFICLALYCAIRGWTAVDGSFRVWQILSVISCLLAVGCKETAVAAPLLVFAYHIIFVMKKDDEFLAELKRNIILCVGYGVCMVLLGALALKVGASAGNFKAVNLSPFAYAMSQCEVILHYLRLAFWPDALCLDYVWPFMGYAYCLPYLLLLAVIGYVCVRAAGGNRHALFPLVWFAITLAPSSSFFPIRDLAFEHRMYLPLAGVLCFAVVGFWMLLDRRGLLSSESGVYRCFWPVVFGVCVVFGVRTHARNADYATDVDMWADVVSKRPLNARALMNLGVAGLMDGHLNIASYYLKKATALREYEKEKSNLASDHEPDGEASEAYCNFGVALAKLGREEEAWNAFQKAIKAAPGMASPYNNFAAMLINLKKYDMAMQLLDKAFSVEPDNIEARRNLATVFMDTGKFADAERQMRLFMESGRAMPKDYYEFGRILAAVGKREEAVKAYLRGVEEGVDGAKVYTSLGFQYAALGELDKALKDFRKAVEIAPDNMKWRCNLAIILVRMGRFNEAEEEYLVAIVSNPDDVIIRLNYARLLIRMERLEDALAQYRLVLNSAPANVDAHTGAGIVLMKMKSFGEAIAELNRAVSADPANDELWFYLASAYAEIGERQKAKQCLARILRRNPRHSDARKMYIKLGR